MTRRIFLAFQIITGRARLLQQDVYQAQRELATSYNEWIARLDENLRNGIVDRRVLHNRKELEEKWKRFWTAVERWSTGV